MSTNWEDIGSSRTRGVYREDSRSWFKNPRYVYGREAERGRQGNGDAVTEVI